MGHQVTLCADMIMLPEREKMGWRPENTEGISLLVGLSWEEAKRVMADSPRDAVHFISGVRGVNHGGRLTRLAARSGRRICWICETWDHRGWRGALRGLLYRAEAIYYRRVLERVFAMGDLGVADYVAVGHLRARVVPFNYVVAYVPSLRGLRPTRSPFVFGYVGALIPRKRVDLLLRALATLPHEVDDWVVEIHGDGPERAALETLAGSLGIACRVRWCGKFDSNESPKRMAGLDTLVLPSDFDGWGAVVNEALLCGVPVVVSDACGAACLPRRHGWGCTFGVGDVGACARACLDLLESPVAVDAREVDAVIGPRATASRLTGALS